MHWSWSLAIEEQFYILLPALLLLFARTRLRWTLFIAGIALAVIVRVAIMEYHDLQFPILWHDDAIYHDNFDLLYDTPETIGKLRQAILQLAVQGKLVPQDPNDEPASVLLEELKLSKQMQVSKNQSTNIASLPPAESQDKPFDAPKTWEWKLFGELAEIVSGVTDTTLSKWCVLV